MEKREKAGKAAASAMQDENRIDRLVTAVALIATVGLILFSPLA